MISAGKITLKGICLLRQGEKKIKNGKTLRTVKRKNTKVKQDESRDNKIDKWRSSKCGNKEKKTQKMRWARYKDTYLKTITSNV